MHTNYARVSRFFCILSFVTCSFHPNLSLLFHGTSTMVLLSNGTKSTLKNTFKSVRYLRDFLMHFSAQFTLTPFPPINCFRFRFVYHREITPTGLSGPRFHAPLHIFSPPPGPAGVPSRTTGWGWGRSLVAFNVTKLILVLEIQFNF